MTTTIIRTIDTTTRDGILVAADRLEDAGHDAEAATLRSAPPHWSARAVMQQTAEGSRVVTVARNGAATASCGNGWSVPIYTTAIYAARRRQSDGLLTWRLVWRSPLTTAGRGVTGPMVLRAQEEAAERGLPFRGGIRHGLACD